MSKTIEDLITFWNSDDGKPYKGQLIDYDNYLHNLPPHDPTNLGCMCAQGQVLTVLGGLSAEAIHESLQDDVDNEVARLLGISRTHSVMLRRVNDTVDGAPASVLTNPEQFLGPQADQILDMWMRWDALEWTGRDQAYHRVRRQSPNFTYRDGLQTIASEILNISNIPDTELVFYATLEMIINDPARRMVLDLIYAND